MEGNFGRCKLWRIHYKNTFGEINFVLYIVLNKVAILAEEALANLWSFTKSANVSPSKVTLYTVCDKYNILQ